MPLTCDFFSQVFHGGPQTLLRHGGGAPDDRGPDPEAARASRYGSRRRGDGGEHRQADADGGGGGEGCRGTGRSRVAGARAGGVRGSVSLFYFSY